ncbi:Rho-binding antiterminator [Pseudomonas nitroreducens]|uniref:Rho-binding antiterminator n=1 Tax=Pseudomonas nitroreducens TaxID=46680 RepID=UPI0026585722|nr:Rho-binding antiterminator [Pseudomonas nitroreducens]MCP1651093.1 Rho-binding antiterminator [Pseudomonas nitroreducens]MCP1684382.1 Rho-binding antiterminator [Pseudomonas nitroreducens]
MSGYQPLHCDLHDYLEIACLYRYWLRIELRDGLAFDAQAFTTQTRRNAGGVLEEFLEVRGDGASRELRLDRLRAITPLSAQALFGRVMLGPA